jgi:hypothetical protein
VLGIYNCSRYDGLCERSYYHDLIL